MNWPISENQTLVLMDICPMEVKWTVYRGADVIKEELNIPVVYLQPTPMRRPLNSDKEAHGPFGYIIKPFEDRELHSHRGHSLQAQDGQQTPRRVRKDTGHSSRGPLTI